MMQKSKRISYLFIDQSRSANFQEHIQKADLVVKLGLRFAIFIYSIFGTKSSKFPYVGQAVRAFLALVDLHNSPLVKSTHRAGNKTRVDSCSFKESNFDEIIIGSGPGGSVAFDESVKSGKKVLLIEQGFLLDKELPHHGVQQLANYFSGGGQQVILSKNLIPFAQGSAFGGGSAVNSGLYHDIPEILRTDWFRNIPFDDFEWMKAEKKVRRDLRVATQSETSLGIYSASPIIDLAINKGWDYERVSRWRTYDNFGFVHHSCYETYIENNLEKSYLLSSHEARKVSLDSGNVKVYVRGPNCHHEISSKFLTLSAGTTSTPEILLRSGLADVGQLQFNFHSMARIYTEFNRSINDLIDIDPHQTWNSDMSMKIGASASTRDFLDATKRSLGIQSNHCPEASLVLYLSSVPVGKGGLVRIGDRLNPYFKLSREYMRQLGLMIEEINQALIEIGAEKVYANPNKPFLSTVHIFGSLPLLKSRVIDRFGFVNHTKRNIRVCDASLLPMAPRVNPQGAVCVLSHLLSQYIHERIWT